MYETRCGGPLGELFCEEVIHHDCVACAALGGEGGLEVEIGEIDFVFVASAEYAQCAGEVRSGGGGGLE